VRSGGGKTFGAENIEISKLQKGERKTFAAFPARQSTDKQKRDGGEGARMKTINISKVMFVQFRIDWENFIFLCSPPSPTPDARFSSLFDFSSQPSRPRHDSRARDKN
jgi:hypothetical protein